MYASASLKFMVYLSLLWLKLKLGEVPILDLFLFFGSLAPSFIPPSLALPAFSSVRTFPIRYALTSPFSAAIPG
jgi:hypothetical protein